MTTPVQYMVDEKDFDDAALWAVIDSAEASHSYTKSRKPVVLKYPNFHSSPTPVSHPSPFPQNPNKKRSPISSNSYSLPHKIPRSCISEITSPLALVRTPIANSRAQHLSTESYLSPQIGPEVSCGSLALREEEKEVVVPRHCLNGRFPSVSLFKDYQNAAMAILEKSDYTMISGHPFIKKSGWRKMSFYFNISYEIKDRIIEFDDNRNVQRAEFVVRAHMQASRFSDGWGSCERREKRFLKPNHDIPSTAETRAKNKACQDLLGIGEYRPGVSQVHQ